MTPQFCIARLDARLKAAGMDISLQRMSGSGQTFAVASSLACRAMVRSIGRGYLASELVGNIAQQDQTLVISPSEIIATAWTSGRLAPDDTRIPMKGNRVVVAGHILSVEAAQPFYMQNILVRIELQVRG